MKKIFLHVGYPKCASSYFQEFVFPKFNHINYIGKGNSDFFNKFLTCNDSKNDVDFIRSMIPDNNLPTLISIEALLGIASNGVAQRELFVNRLYKIFPKAEIIIFIRKQTDIIESIFSEWMVHGETGSYDVNTLFETRKKKYSDGRFSFEYFNYHSIFELYCSKFGRSNVNILLFEDFLDNRRLFVKYLAGIIGVNEVVLVDNQKVRGKLSPASHFFARYINRFRKGFFNPGGALDYDSTFTKWIIRCFLIVNKIYYFFIRNNKHRLMNAKNISFIYSYYEASNRKLARNLKRDLKIIGY